MSKNHKPIDERELQQADVTAYALGELSADEAALFERRNALSGSSSGDAALPMDQARRLGQILRANISDDVVGIDSTTAESQRCSAQIRESVLSALDGQETTPATKPDSQDSNLSRRSRTRIWTWSLIASIAIAIGGFMFWSSQDNQSQVAVSGGFESLGEQRLKRVEPSSGQEIRIGTESQKPSDKAGSVESRLADYDAKFAESEKPQEMGRGNGLGTRRIGNDTTKDGEQYSFASPETVDNASVPHVGNNQTALPIVNVPDGGTIVAGGIVRQSNGDTQGRRSDQFSTGELLARIEIAQEEQGLSLNYSASMPVKDLDSDEKFHRDFSIDRKEIELSIGRGGQRNPANEQYKSIPENPFWRPNGERAMSTFSVDVDTASYANVRRFLNEGSLPPPDAVRLEEFINYFHYDYPQPEEGSPFAVDLKLFGCPWNAQHSLLRVGLHGREIKSENRPVSNIVYLVDVSGSMSDENKLPLLKRGLSMMVDHLGESDTVSIVTYAGDAGVKLEPTNGSHKKRILDAIDSLQSGGSTNGAAGIEVAYRLAQQKFVNEGANRVILMTDGDLNVGVTSDEALVNIIKEKAASGVFLTVLGFGTGNLKDGKLEGLADNGNGIYGYIDSLGEAHKVLVEQMSGNLVTIAKDVKIQIEFNPAQVAGYRLIGYENRVMANQDFSNDRKDAGEIGAGHTVTALYEIVPVGAMLDAVDPASPTLKYQTLGEATRSDTAQTKADIKLTDAAASGELARVALRFKTPEGTESRLIEFTAKAEVTSFSQADADCRFAAAVAAFGMHLRNSQFAGNMTLDAIAEIASAATGPDPNGHRAEFIDLVRRAKELRSMRD